MKVLPRGMVRSWKWKSQETLRKTPWEESAKEDIIQVWKQRQRANDHSPNRETQAGKLTWEQRKYSMLRFRYVEFEVKVGHLLMPSLGVPILLFSCLPPPLWKSQNVYSPHYHRKQSKGIPSKLKDVKFASTAKQDVKGHAPYLAKQKYCLMYL